MRKLHWMAVVTGVISIGLAGYIGGGLVAGKPEEKLRNVKVAEKLNEPPPVTATSPDLPICKVIVFNSGVAYFERQGEIEGDTRIDLSFSVNDINDLIKSMVVQDLDGGKVSAVSFDNLAPVDRALRSFAVDLSDNPTYSQVLNQARGERVEVVLQQSNTTQPGTITGAVMGVENKPALGAKDSVLAIEHLNLWCAEGMRSIKLSDVLRIRFLNPAIEGEFKKALDTMTQTHDTQKKAVSLICSGKGKRRVRVGYIAENPIWKTSYRLVLDPEKKPFLQGWAVVENNSDEDWNKVVMKLISGRPISFQMDLYEPLYVQRPVIEPEQFASLRPSSYAGVVKADESSWLAARDQRRMSSSVGGMSGSGLQFGGQVGQFGGQLGGLQFGGLQFGGLPPGAGSTFTRPETMNIQQGISAVANATKSGNFFQYQIDYPVTLGRQKSAMLPIVNHEIDGIRVSVYNEKVQPRYAMFGFRIKNTTNLHLNHGPVTVFDGANYAGDAYLPDLEPGQLKLLTYAVDLATEVHSVAAPVTGRRTFVKTVKGIAESGTRYRRSWSYTIINRSDEDRLIIIDHPREPRSELVNTAKPLETTKEYHRFEQKVGKNKSIEFVVNEEYEETSRYTLADSDGSIQLLIEEPVASKELKDALRTAQAKRLDLAATQSDVRELERDIALIKEEQPRMRENLKVLPESDPLVKKLRDKLLQQENDLEKYDNDLKKLQTKAAQQRKDLENYLADLTFDK
jgi:hypothetical protein